MVRIRFIVYVSLGKRVRRTLYDPSLSVFLARSDGEVYEMGEVVTVLPLLPPNHCLTIAFARKPKTTIFSVRITKLYHVSNIRYFLEPLLAKNKPKWFYI